jgi:hypothetical protein
MADIDQLQLALGVLPALPCDVTALRAEGGRLDVRLTEVKDGRFSAQLSILDIRDGAELCIPIDHRRGGFSIECRVKNSYLIGGLDALTSLEVLAVTRRKPHREHDRQSVQDTATVSVIAADQLPAGAQLTTRLLDVSAYGAAFLTEQAFEPGDLIRITATVNGRSISTVARVMNASRQAFGRKRIGCRFDTPIHALQHLRTHDPLTGLLRAS